LSAGRLRLLGLAWAGILVLVLAALAGLVNQGALRFSDNLLLLAAQGPSGPALDWVMWGISLSATLEVTTILVLVFAFTERGPRLPAWERFLPLAVFVLVIVVELVGKYLVHQPGPPRALLRGPRFHMLGLTMAYAFPSGHMTRITMVLGLYGVRLARRRRNPLWLWLCVAAVWLVGYSRVYLGEHWPADVAGGILLGGVGLAVCLAISPRATIGHLEDGPGAAPPRGGSAGPRSP